MSDFFNDPLLRKARKQCKCTYCAESIHIGEEYVFQKGNWDGRWFESKMHPECFDAMSDDDDGEYLPYYNERPRKQ